jgi:uncharacterized protein
MKYLRHLAWLLLLTLPSFAEKVATMPAPTGYIDDYAKVLSAPAKVDMESTARELHTKTRAQVFLVTINTLEGEPVETFANELFAKWKIGEKKTDRGVLMLFAIRDRKRWIEIGYGLEGILNDAKVGDIGRDMVPALRAANYDEATKLGLNEICQVIAADSGVTLATLSNAAPIPDQNAAPPPPVEPAPASSSLSNGRWVLIAFPMLWFFLFFAFIVWNIRKAIHRGTRLGSPGSGSTWSSSSFGDSTSFSDSSSSSSSSDDSFSGGDGGSSGGRRSRRRLVARPLGSRGLKHWLEPLCPFSA